MKYRLDFVTNSSSSSYICEVCGRAEGGYDFSLEDADMYECSNGHCFCRGEAIGEVNYLKYLMNYRYLSDAEKEELKDLSIDDLHEEALERELEYSYPDENCPVCTLTAVPDYLMIRYLLRRTGETKNDITKEVQRNFCNLKSLNDYINQSSSNYEA